MGVADHQPNQSGAAPIRHTNASPETRPAGVATVDGSLLGLKEVASDAPQHGEVGRQADR